jgi:ATP-dependent Clp protease ATP-binding subunit ClpC
LRRVIQRKIEDELSEQILLGRFKEGDSIIAVLKDNEITFEKSAEKAPGKKPSSSEVTA